MISSVKCHCSSRCDFLSVEVDPALKLEDGSTHLGTPPFPKLDQTALDCTGMPCLLLLLLLLLLSERMEGVKSPLEPTPYTGLFRETLPAKAGLSLSLSLLST